MTTTQSCRCILAAGAALIGIGLLTEGVILTGVLCLITAVLLVPFLYDWLYIRSNEVQLLAPLAIMAVAVFSFAMWNSVPRPYLMPPRPVYTDSEETSATTTSVSVTTVTTTQTAKTTTDMTVTAPQLVTTTQMPVTQTQSTITTTVTTVNSVVYTVYRTPSGKRYHLDPECGGVNSYEVSYEDAVSAGLSPCKKCAGG